MVRSPKPTLKTAPPPDSPWTSSLWHPETTVDPTPEGGRGWVGGRCSGVRVKKRRPKKDCSRTRSTLVYSPCLSGCRTLNFDANSRTSPTPSLPICPRRGTRVWWGGRVEPEGDRDSSVAEYAFQRESLGLTLLSSVGPSPWGPLPCSWMGSSNTSRGGSFPLLGFPRRDRDAAPLGSPGLFVVPDEWTYRRLPDQDVSISLRPPRARRCRGIGWVALRIRGRTRVLDC